MSQKLGLLACLAYSVGGMIGSGIFVAPTSVLLHSGSPGLSLCLWIGGALVSATGALVYVELGTCIPETGGGFAYQMRAKWKWAAFPFFWLGALFTCPMILAIQTTGLSQLIIQTLKQGFELGDTVALIIQWSCGLLALGPSEALAHPFENSTNKPFELVLGLYASLFTYTGWEALNTALGEVENPKLVLPIASIGGIFIVCIISILLNVAYFSVIDTKEFLKTSAVAALFCERTMGHVSIIIPLLIALLMLANLNTTLFATSRYMFAGAAKRALPRTFACQHPTHLTPRVSVAAQVILAAALSFIGNLDQLISYMSYAELMDRLSVQFALIYMRLQKV
ncbi:hypothetical protein M3Y97_00143000 [Aphelenchoides bicaudatus]|nr:hypothetical protein M3Y97_00143000 [Aphelenchoides bicaudatus]